MLKGSFKQRAKKDTLSCGVIKGGIRNASILIISDNRCNAACVVKGKNKVKRGSSWDNVQHTPLTVL